MRTGKYIKFYLVMLFLFCPNILWAAFVPVETARRVAVNSLNKSIQAKALQRRQKESADVEVEQPAVPKITEQQITETFAATEKDVLVYYVFNLAPDGWAIISADDVAYPVIGYSLSGLYDPNVSNQPPAFTAWMDNVAAEIADAVARGLQGLPDAAATWKELSVEPADFAPNLAGPKRVESVEPLVQSTWGQGDLDDWWPWDLDSYNEYCPWEYSDWTHTCRLYCPTGCVATAMAQIMRYWQWPPVGYGWHGYDPPYECSHDCSGFGWREVDFSQQDYAWPSMPLDTHNNAIARLMRDIGIAMEMNYTPSSSSASTSDAPDAYRDYFRYNAGDYQSRSSYPDTWSGMLMEELCTGRPILYRGHNGGGHAFVCDGYEDWGASFHFNWGWDGSYNGYFTLNDLTPGSHDYSNNQAAVLGIEPYMSLEVYVDDDYSADGGNDGHVWRIDAFDNIQDAILLVSPGGTVYVSAGSYNGPIDFAGKAIRLCGLEGPDVTIIDGTGHYHVVQCVSGEDASTVLEGFTVTGGNAHGSWPGDHGGGMYNSLSSPTVINCIFSGNSAIDFGGGMFNHYCSPTVTECKFSWNAADSGGGMYNYYSNPTVTDCNFSRNSAFHGGGVFNSETSSVSLIRCAFLFNSADNGGALYNYSVGNVMVTDCSFVGNTSALYGGAMNNAYSSPTVSNCFFADNSGASGGAMYNDNSSPTVSSSDFTGNTADYGAAMSNYWYSSSSVTNCTFSGNSAGYYGAGMYNYESSPTVAGCAFSSNTADWSGSGMTNTNSSPRVTNCTFSGNSADSGAGMDNGNCSSTLTNCTFFSNAAEWNGGGMRNWESSPIMTNCTFVNNSADNKGGGMYNDYSSRPTVINCILWDNKPNEIYNSSSTPTVTYSNVEGGWGGEGNIDADPYFVDSVADNLRLIPGSPCIDVGDNSAPDLPLTDLDGHPRIIDGDCNGVAVVDMGAYEFNYAYIGDLDYNCAVDFGDFSVFAPAWQTALGQDDYDTACNISDPPDDYIDWRDLAVIAENWLATAR